MAAARFEHGSYEILERELRIEPSIGCRQHSSRGNQLDPVGSRTEGETDCLPHLLGTIGEIRRSARVIGQRVVNRAFKARACQEAVRMTSRRADGDNRDLHRGPWHVAGRNTVANPRICDTGVADERDACREGASQDVGRLEHPARERRTKQLEGVETGQARMKVTVEDPGQQPQSVAVEHHFTRAGREILRNSSYDSGRDKNVQGSAKSSGLVQHVHPMDEQARRRRAWAAKPHRVTCTRGRAHFSRRTSAAAARAVMWSSTLRRPAFIVSTER